jgi:HK97 family phage major capsid protein
MDRTLTQRLIDERNVIWERAKAIMDTAETEGRDLTAEEQSNIDATNSDLDSRDAHIKSLQVMDERAALANSARDPRVTSPSGLAIPTDARALLAVARGEQRFAEFRALETSTDTVPTGFYAQVQAYQRTLNPTYSLATVLKQTNGEPLLVPRLTADPTTYTPGQGTAITPADPTVSSVTITPISYKTLTLWSAELSEDTAVNLQSVVATSAGRSIGLSAGAAMTTGTYGFVTLGSNGGTASGTPFFDADDLITLYYGRPQPVRMAPTAAWQMSNSAIAKSRKFKTSTTNEYLWQPGLAIGTPDSLMGRPVYENPTMATVASASKSVAFGDFASYFAVEVVPMRVESSRDYAFNTDSVALKVVWRVGGQLPDVTAIAYLISAAS